MISFRKTNILILACLLLIVFGICVGEEFIRTIFIYHICLFLIISLFPIGWYLGGKHLLKRCLGLFLLPAIFIGSWWCGIWDYSNAVKECEQKGELLRSALSQYKSTNGKYPETLNQLGLNGLPGNRLIGENILKYRSFESDVKNHSYYGYKLYFYWGICTEEATETKPYEKSFP